MNFVRHPGHFIASLLLINASFAATSHSFKYHHASEPIPDSQVEEPSNSAVIELSQKYFPETDYNPHNYDYPSKSSSEDVSGQLLQEALESLKRDVNKMDDRNNIDIGPPQKDALSPMMTEILPKDKTLLNQVLKLLQISKSDSDVNVITQAFRFVRLDAHLATLLSQLGHLRQSQESLQAESIKQQAKFEIVLEEIRSLAANIGKESVRLTEVEERLESEMEGMSDRMDSAIEKIIQSSVSTQVLLDLSKETIQQTDKSVGISNEVLSELRSVRTELGDVGQASVQTIYNVQKLEESLLMGMEEAGNRTIDALRQDQQLQYQLLPSSSPLKMNVDELSLVPLGNVSVGNSMQADGTILPESNSPPVVYTAATVTDASPEEQSLQNITSKLGKNEELKAKDLQLQTKKSTVQEQGESHLSPCPSLKAHAHHHGKKIEHPKNCEEIQLLGHASSGVYRVYPFDLLKHPNGSEVYCDLLSAGGGWTVIQKRKEPLFAQEDFEKSWDEYASGFGILHDSHWIGLEVIAALTKTGDSQLRVEMTDWEGDVRVAEYGYFRIANAASLYRMYVTDYSGDAGDSLAYHNGMAFTTKDRDNDLEKNVNCAQKYHGAWWYKSCHQSNLNGLYMEESKGKHDSYANGVNWYSWHGYYYSLKRTEMKIRSRHFQPDKLQMDL